MEALDTYDAARLPVAPPASGVVAGDPKQRQRFYVELAPGATTLVSWKELVREANNQVVSVDSTDKALVQEDTNQVESPDSSDKYPVEEYVQVEKSRIDESCSIVKRDKVQHKTETSLQEEKSAQHDLQSRSSMSMKISPTLSAETVKEEISYLILIFLIQTMHRF
ncbi:hypothetical protein POM88_012100 [Heracleum sosnowskyi]|uniref:Uncharacterized protein n=1 Tax=Heracleum sosnowskyi TaxID=360622 RepID=A0AAD8IXI8_9APIA|nr:hypothetical protein POM88_012100 [Heracleum sosnowskyi]